MAKLFAEYKNIKEGFDEIMVSLERIKDNSLRTELLIKVGRLASTIEGDNDEVQDI